MTSNIALINRFPRELARPFKDKIAWDLDEVNKYIERFGSSYGIHISVYPFSTIDEGKIDYSSAIIDKIFIDIDGRGWLKQLRKVFRWAMFDDIISRYNMSGMGAHAFLFCIETIQYKRSCIHNFQSYLERKLKITIDPQVKGDLSRTFRIPNTFNYKRGRYDICMDEDLIFNHTEKEIYEIASKFPTYEPKQVWYGNELMDLSSFDIEEYMYGTKLSTDFDGDLLEAQEIDNLNIPFDKFPPCVRSWLSDKELGYKGRYCLIIYLRDQQITPIPFMYKEVVSILRNILCRNTWLHVSTNLRIPGHNVGEGLRTVRNTYSNVNYKMYSCYQLRDFNLCPKRCGRWHPIYD